MADFSFLIFAADNLINPQNPGFLPAEDSSFRSDLVNGDQITWTGGGESAFITVTDNTSTTFDEAQSNQRLTNPVTFDGVSYSANQVVTPTYTIVFSGSDGNTYTLTSFNFSGNTNNEIPDAVFWEGSIPPSGTVLTVTSEINPTGSTARDYNDFVACFCAGTLIETVAGPTPVEHLTSGDLILTQRGDAEAVQVVCHRHIGPSELAASPKLRPVLISQGALGQGLPLRDLRVSRQHRLSVASPICQRMFAEAEVLVSAIQLTQLPGVYIDTDITEVSYYHILLNDHDVILAEGAPAESLYLGAHAVHALTDAARREVQTIFPDLMDNQHLHQPARHIPLGRRQRQLIARHRKNAKPLLC